MGLLCFGTSFLAAVVAPSATKSVLACATLDVTRLVTCLKLCVSPTACQQHAIFSLSAIRR